MSIYQMITSSTTLNSVSSDDFSQRCCLNNTLTIEIKDIKYGGAGNGGPTDDVIVQSQNALQPIII